MPEYRGGEQEFGCPDCGRCDCVCDDRREPVDGPLPCTCEGLEEFGYGPDTCPADPPPAEHSSLCAGCGEPLESEPSGDGLCPPCEEITGRAEEWQERTGGGRWG